MWKGSSKVFGLVITILLVGWALGLGVVAHDNHQIKKQQEQIEDQQHQIVELKSEIARQTERPPDVVKIALMHVAERVNDTAIWAWTRNPNTGEWSKHFWNICPGPEHIVWDKDVVAGATIYDFWYRDDALHGCTDMSTHWEGYSITRYTGGKHNGDPILQALWRPE